MNELDAINEITFLLYIFFGWILIAFSIIVVKQKRVLWKERRAVVYSYLSLGMFFCFAAGRIVTGGAELYMYLVLLACFCFIFFAAKQVISIYRQNRELRKKDNEQS